MPRPIWKGSLSFGLVNVPVALYPATSDKTLHFHQVEDGTSDRIRYKKVNERTGKEVPPERIVKAMDMGVGEYVIVSDEELADAEPEKSRTIDIEGFVDLAEIDPIYFRTTYYLAPQNDAAAKAYQLLREAMESAGKIGVASFVHAEQGVPRRHPSRGGRPRARDPLLRRRDPGSGGRAPPRLRSTPRSRQRSVRWPSPSSNRSPRSGIRPNITTRIESTWRHC